MPRRNPPQDPYYAAQYPYQERPREIVTTRGMGGGEAAIHWTMIICTAGLWLPVYWSRKRSTNRKTRTTIR